MTHQHTTWKAAAACRNTNTAIFFDPDHTTTALAYCQRCPVRTQCGEAGRTEVGIWGGQQQRDRPRRRRRYHDDGYAGVAPGVATIGPEHPAHGRASGYNHHRCRCDRCRRWAREQRRRSKDR